MEYLGGPPAPGCALCRALESGELVVHRGARAFVLMNLYPYSNGHVMVAPIDHIGDYGDLPDEVGLEIISLTRRAIRALVAAEHPEGFNLGMNLGRAAGAGIADHLHQHVVPRWTGDTNFMPVLGGAKTIGEAIEQTLEKIRAHF
jgi:ATP adenylyltransferase